MLILSSLFVFIFGLAIGSFIAAYSYRLQNGVSITDGRSFCDNCGKQLTWYDNIPLFSYLFLLGKSRCCKKRISPRYPIIEFSVAAIFSLIYLTLLNCTGLEVAGSLCSYNSHWGALTLPYFLFVAGVLAMIFIIDWESQIIPDELVYILFGSFLLLQIFSGLPIYVPLLTGFSFAFMLLSLNLLTFGKGMGLGDVKFALVAGLVLGWPLSIVWMFLSFVVGAGVGIVLIFAKKASFGKHIPFGPFLVFALLFTLLFGEKLLVLFPYLR